MNEALIIVRKYYSNWQIFDGMQDKIIRNTLIKEWNKYENEWFINYLNENLGNNTLELTKMMDLLKKLNVELNLLTLKDVLSKCIDFDLYLSRYFKNDKMYTIDELEKYDEGEILIAYATIKNKLEEDLDDERDYQDVMVSSSDKMYLTEMHNIPMLSWEETRSYFEKIEELKKLIKDEKSEELINKYNKKIEFYQKRIVEGNLSLVIKPAVKYLNRGLDFLDLIQEGNIGLMHAVEMFKLSVGARFSTYSMWWIRQSINRAVYDKGKNIRIPVHRAEDFAKIYKQRIMLEQNLGREVKTEELAKHLNMDIKTLEEYLLQFETIRSLDDTGGSLDDDREYYETIPSEESFESEFINKELLNSLLDKLNEEEEEIIRLRFGIMKNDNDIKHIKTHTLAEIGKIFGVTRERSRQKIDVVLQKLIKYAHLNNEKSFSVVQIPQNFFENFPDVDREEVLKYFNALKTTEKLVLQKRYGINLDTFNTTSKKMAMTANSLIFKIKGMIKMGNLNVERQTVKRNGIVEEEPKKLYKYDGLTIYEITGYSKEEMDNVVSRMDSNSQSFLLLIRVFGADLDKKYDSSKMNAIEKNILNTFIYRLKKLPTIESNRFYYNGKTLSEITGLSNEELLFIVNERVQSKKLLSIIYKVFGETLENVYDSNILSAEEKKILYKFINKCSNRKKNPDKVLEKYVGVYGGKTLSELSGLSQDILLEKFNEMGKNTRTREVLIKAFGPNIDGAFDGLKMSQEEKRIIHTVISRFNAMKKPLNDENNRLLYKSPFTDPMFKTFIKYVPSDLRSVTEISLGFVDGFIHSAYEVSKMLKLDEEEVIIKRRLGIECFIEILNKNIELCKEYIPNFTENIENVLQLIRG